MCCRYSLSHEQNCEILEANMKVNYDSEVDVLRIIFMDTPIEEK